MGLGGCNLWWVDVDGSAWSDVTECTRERVGVWWCGVGSPGYGRECLSKDGFEWMSVDGLGGCR